MPGGSVVERLPLAQVMIIGSQDRVPRRAPYMEPASPSACALPPSLPLCLSQIKKILNNNNNKIKARVLEVDSAT